MKDNRKSSNIDGFYLFKALCKKILGRTDYIAQDHSLIAKGDVVTMNNVSRAISPDLVLSNQIITALQTSQSIRPQCEFVVSLRHLKIIDSRIDHLNTFRIVKKCLFNSVSEI